ncbi:MFS transporter [Actinoplanes sp. HUAS TT8]|uniref:MFS transporter n=1 Tax=Actinoplanes sp. HUAS TT8 TaxID=3447453 RepID=UPI003F521C78
MTKPLLGISFGYFIVLLDMTVLAVAEPDLAAGLHASVTGLQWATTGYTVMFGALLPAGGAVADRYGAHRAFRAGVAAFGALSLLSASAPSLPVLVILRMALGAAAAACVPASLALIARLHPEPGARTRAVGLWAAISGAAVAVGPVVGGVLVDLAGWRAVFVVNVPITVLVLALVAGPAVRCPAGDRRIDWPAQAILALALAAGTDALIAAGAGSWLHAAISTVAATAFARLRHFARPRQQVLAGLVAGAAVNFALNGTLFVLPLLLRSEHHLTASGTGLVLLPLTVPFVLGPPVTGRLVSRFGPRPPILAGLFMLSIGSMILAAAVWSDAGYAVLTAGLFVSGSGVSLVLPPVVAAVLTAAPPGTAGTAGGLLNAVRQGGATAGVAAMGALLQAGVHSRAGSGTALALLLATAVSAGSATYFRKMF